MTTAKFALQFAAIAISAVVASPLAAWAQGGLILRPGEAVVLRPDAVGAGWQIDTREDVGNAAMSQWEQVGLVLSTNPAGAANFRPSADLPASRVAQRDVVSARFRRVEGTGDAVLVIENGFSQRLRFSAAIARADSFAPTDVCEVMGGRNGMEHWPYPIAEISLDRLRLLPETGADVACDEAPDALPPVGR